jgi:hypothetical protein
MGAIKNTYIYPTSRPLHRLIHRYNAPFFRNKAKLRYFQGTFGNKLSKMAGIGARPKRNG